MQMGESEMLLVDAEAMLYGSFGDGATFEAKYLLEDTMGIMN